MKRAIVLTFIFLCALQVSAQELTPVFGPFVQVTPNNLTGSTRPRIALVQDSIPLVTWTKPGSPAGIVYTARWNGTGFDVPLQVSPSGLNIYCSADEGGDIAARGDTAYIVFFTTSSVCYCVSSYDGGLSWSDTVRINHLPMRHAYTPDVQIDRNGNPVVVFESSDMNMANTAIMVCRSNDGGQTFSAEQPAHTNVSGVPCECCPPALLISDEMTYVAYRNNDNNRRDIVVTISADSGNTFPTVSEIDQTNWTISACPTAGAEFAFYRDSILVVWKSANKLFYGCAENQSGAAGTDNLLEPALAASVIQKHPYVSTTGDTVIYLWDDRRTTNYDCYISIHGNGVQQVTTPFVINDTIGTAENGTQQTPHAVLEGNVLHIIYQNSATGIVMYRRATIGGVVGMAEQPVKFSPSVYPVPANESFTVTNIEGRCVLSIYNLYGQPVIYNLPVVDGQKINIESLVSGTYTVIIRGQDGIQSSFNLIKQ